MKKSLSIPLLFTVLLMAGMAWAATRGYRNWVENQALTRAPPAPADFASVPGMDMTDVCGFDVGVCTRDGVNRLLGTGSIEFYVWDGLSADAGHVPSLSTNVTGTGPCWFSGDREPLVRRGQMIVGTNGLTTVDAGTVTVRVRARLCTDR